MAHHTIESGYQRLTERLNRFSQGAPPAKLLFRILALLFSEKEAEFVSQLPIKPFTCNQAAAIWKMPVQEARKVLEDLASRAILLDMEGADKTYFVLPPPMAGFFEFSLMRIREDIDQKLLSELFYQYLNVEEEFILELFTRGETQLGRIFVHEPALSIENSLHVLDYERASEVIKSATSRGVSMCYCRHKMSHLNRACNAPMEICMTFNVTAAALIRHGHAREVDQSECLDLLNQAYDHNLVQFGENVRESVNFVCNCCGCCCEAMIAARKFAILHPVHTTNFIPVLNDAKCFGCGACVNVCPVEAMALVSANDPHGPNRKFAKLNKEICLGCGVCTRVCKQSALELKSRKSRLITPLNGAHRAILMAIERGKLQNLIFDNQALWSHRALACILGVILRLPPIKQLLALKQFKSRYLEALIVSSKNKRFNLS